MEPRAHKICDCCGRGMAKASMLYEGKAYCKSCYKKHFWAVPCDTCGNLTGSYHGAEPVTCKICRSKGRKCMDCGELVVNKGEKGRRIALTLPDGVICQNCIHHFKEEKPCAACGKLTKYLCRDIKAGFLEPVCNSCRHGARNFAHCSICGKYRYEHKIIDGKNICFTCNKERVVCTECGKPALSEGICADCNWKVFARNLARNTAFAHEWVHTLLVDFCEELINRHGGYDTKEKLTFYMPFFATLDQEFQSQNEVTVNKLCRLYPQGLNKYDVPYHFLGMQKIVPLDRQKRSDEYSFLKQERIVSGAKGTWYSQVLKNFHEYLLSVRERYQRRGWKGKHEKFKMVSISSAVACAELFLRTVDVTNIRQVSQENIEIFMLNNKAYKNSLYGFVRFLNIKGRLFQKLDMTGLPKQFNAYSLHDNEYETLMLRLLSPGEKDIKESLVLLFMLIYSQRPRTLCTLKLEDIFFKKNSGYWIFFARDEVNIVPAVADILDRYLDIRSKHKDVDNEYLFPGLLPGTHLSSDTIKEYPEKFEVGGKELFSTSLTRLSKFKLKFPNALTKSLGISTYTAVRYLSVFNERVQKEAAKVFRR